MTSSTEVHDAILAVDKTFMAAFSRGDAAGIAALYTESGQFMPPHSDIVTGKEAIQAVVEHFMNVMGAKAINLNTVETEGHGDIAFEVGRYTLEGDGGQVLDQGKYMVIWKQEAGQWKLHRDMFNTSMPPPQ